MNRLYSLPKSQHFNHILIKDRAFNIHVTGGWFSSTFVYWMLRPLKTFMILENRVLSNDFYAKPNAYANDCNLKSFLMKLLSMNFDLH